MRSTEERLLADKAFEHHDQWYGRLNDAAIASGTLAVRMALILNGGASIALLAFLASIFSNGNAPENLSGLADRIVLALGSFGWGAFCAGLCSGLSYLVNRCWLSAAYHKKKSYEFPYISDTRRSWWWNFSGTLLQVCAIFAALVSYLLFVRGLMQVQGFY